MNHASKNDYNSNALSYVSRAVAKGLVALGLYATLGASPSDAAELSRGREKCLVKYMSSQPKIVEALENLVYDQISDDVSDDEAERQAQAIKNSIYGTLMNQDTKKMTWQVKEFLDGTTVSSHRFNIYNQSGKPVLGVDLDGNTWKALDAKIIEFNCNGCPCEKRQAARASYASHNQHYSTSRASVDGMLQKYQAGAHPIHFDGSFGEALFGIAGGFAGSAVAGRIRGGNNNGGNNSNNDGNNGGGNNDGGGNGGGGGGGNNGTPFTHPQEPGINPGLSNGAHR